MLAFAHTAGNRSSFVRADRRSSSLAPVHLLHILWIDVWTFFSWAGRRPWETIRRGSHTDPDRDSGFTG